MQFQVAVDVNCPPSPAVHVMKIPRAASECFGEAEKDRDNALQLRERERLPASRRVRGPERRRLLEDTVAHGRLSAAPCGDELVPGAFVGVE